MEYIVVLGHALGADGSMSHTLKLRLDRAIETYMDRKPDRIIVTGGKTAPGIDASEADVMAEYLVRHGIEEARIIKEGESLNTIENAYFSKQIIGRQGAGILVVTSDTHAERAGIIFSKVFGDGYKIEFGVSATPLDALPYALEHERTSLKEVIETFSRFDGRSTDAQIRLLIDLIRDKEGKARYRKRAA